MQELSAGNRVVSSPSGNGNGNGHPIEPERFAFDPAACVVFDLEVYPGRWLVGFQGPDAVGTMTTRTVETRDALARMLEHLARKGRTLVGFNSRHFDVPLMRLILAGLDPYAPAQGIVHATREAPYRLPIPPEDLPPVEVDHLDLAERLRRGGRFPSLKTVAANLGRPVLQELPYPPDLVLSDDQWAEVKRYNGVDLGHTRAVLDAFTPELQALAALSNLQGTDLRSTPTPRVVEVVFEAAYRSTHGGRKPSRPETPTEVLYRPLAGVRRPTTPAAAAWYDQVVNTPLPVVSVGGRPKVEVPRATFQVGDLKLSVGAGGVHSLDQERLYYATKKHRLISADVASFYPSLIAQNDITPAAYGDTGAATYRDLLAQRLEVKAQAAAATDPAERTRLDVQATALKLVLNSAFGKYGDPFSSLFDPAALVAVTITGELLLLDLVERLQAAGVKVLSVNTDGAFLRVRRGDARWREVLAGWQADTGMVLEVEDLKRFLTLATNRYATLDRRGKVKRRGDGLKGAITVRDLPNELVVADAVAEALLRDVPPEVTIAACTDPVRFCRVTRRTGSVVSAALVDGSGDGVELPKVTRWYKSRESERRIRHMFADGHHTTPPHATNVALALDLSDGTIPEDLDRNHYVRRARKVIQAVPGYRHLAPQRLGDHPLALEAHARGLVPVPKQGKAQPTGSDTARPTWLWEWGPSLTVGTFTGPLVGLLVVDVDEFAKWAKCVSKNHSPLLEDRWASLAGCLVSVRGDATAAGVRAGRARGKLIFHVQAPPDHPLARMNPSRWLKTRGIEVFYGQGLPSVLGAGPDGTTYRLEGTLGEAPGWLVELLPPGPGRIFGSGKAGGNGKVNGKVDGVAAVVEPTPEALEGLPKQLAELDASLGGRSVQWRTKDLGEGREIWIGRCPFEHTSGESSHGDLAAGFHLDGTPYLQCKHSSCEASREINQRLGAAHRALGVARGDPPALEPPTPITQAFLDDLEAGRVALHVAPTGSGKTHSAAQAAAARYRAGLGTLIAEPSLELTGELKAMLEKFIPDAFEVDAVACVSGQRPALTETDEDDEGPGDAGTYQLHKSTRIVIATQAQLSRRGFSKFLRGLYEAIKTLEWEGGSRPPFAVIIDEVGEFIARSRVDIALAHRAIRRQHPDGSGSWRLPRLDCPKSNRSGSCGNCDLHAPGGAAYGVRTWWSRYAIRELAPPPAVEYDQGGEPLRSVINVVAVDLGDLGIEDLSRPECRVGDTTHAEQVLSYKGRLLDETTRRTADTFTYHRTHDDTGQEYERPAEVLAHMLAFAWRPVVTCEYPIGPNGEGWRVVESAELKGKAESDPKGWDRDIVFPRQTCEVPRLRFTDLVGLERLRRFGEVEGVGVILAGATLCPADREVIRTVWPAMLERQHPYPDRKVKQIAVLVPEGYHGIGSLVADGMLVTLPLEAHGKGVVFCPTNKVARTLYDVVSRNQPTVRLASGNDSEQTVVVGPLLGDDPTRTHITSSRGVLGCGVNVKGITWVAVDCNAFRSIAGFTPGLITAEEFAKMRAEERSALVFQNIGRVLRGEEGKVVVMILLNCDPDLLNEIKVAPAIVQGSELPPVFATGTDLQVLVDQADRWLAAGGGDWPEGDLAKAKTVARGGRPRKSNSRVLTAAEEAMRAGMSWTDFRRKTHPQRLLNPAELDTLHARFEKQAQNDVTRCDVEDIEQG